MSQAAAAIPNAGLGSAGQGSITLVGRTIPFDGTYPTVASSSFCLEIHRLEGPYREGDPPRLTSLGYHEIVPNLGNAVPAPGTFVLIGAAPNGRPIFIHNG